MIAGIILAGGKGERVGGSKPLLPFNGSTLIGTMADRVAPQVERLALNVPAADETLYRQQFAQRFDIVTDAFEQGFGPLAGIIAGLMWAKESGADWLATFPCDAPFLPHDLVACLLAASQLGHPCAAEDTSGFQGACALWPAVCLDRLHDAVESNRVRSVHGALEMLEATRCRFADGNAFFNVNTPEDLAQAEERAKRSPI